MVIDNLHLVSVAFSPNEADTPLIIDPNTVLSFAVAAERFEAIPRRGSQVAQISGCI